MCRLWCGSCRRFPSAARGLLSSLLHAVVAGQRGVLVIRLTTQRYVCFGNHIPFCSGPQASWIDEGLTPGFGLVGWG